MKEKLHVEVSRITQPWVRNGPVIARMSTPLFQFKWPFSWSPSKETKMRMMEGVLGFEITWHVDGSNP